MAVAGAGDPPTDWFSVFGVPYSVAAKTPLRQATINILCCLRLPFVFSVPLCDTIAATIWSALSAFICVHPSSNI
jgi:hypothetical protein